MEYNLLDAEFNCKSEEHLSHHGDKYVGFTKKNQIRKISFDASDFEDRFIDNVLDEFDKRHN